MKRATQKSIKKIVAKTKQQEQDRSWIKPPQTISHSGSGDGPQKLSYWTDKKGEAQLYTRKQLATCNILNNINFLLVKALVLFDTLQTIDEDTTVRTLISQDYARFETTQSSVFNHFIQLMAAVPDVTFGEFLDFMSSESNPKELSKMGKKTLKEVMEGSSKDVTIFYGSDRVKKE